MRLIDADALGIGKAKPEAFIKPEYAYGWNSAIEAINAAPTIDAVPVVRCRDCKHGEVDDPDFPYQYFCHSTGRTWNDENFYCADAEPKARDEE